jgi:hypothetical protein
VLKILILSLVCSGLAYGQEQETPADLAEKKNRQQMDDQAEQLELEKLRAQRKGKEETYDVLLARLRVLAATANKTKKVSDILAFEKNSDELLAYWMTAWKEKHPRALDEAINREKHEETVHLANLLDESLRDPKK